MCICHCFSLTRICTLIQCNVHVCSPSITVVQGFSRTNRDYWHRHSCRVSGIMIICATKCRWQHNQLSWLCSVHVTISSSAAHSRLRFFHFTALPFPCFHQGELFSTVPRSDTRGPYLLPDQVFHTLTTRRQLCNTAPLAGREIQCGQMCNLGKSVDLILNLLYMLTHPTLWNQIFFSDLSKSERPRCLWVIVGRERPRQGDTITGNELQPGGRISVAKSVTSHRCFWRPAQVYAAPIKDLKLSQIFEP